MASALGCITREEGGGSHAAAGGQVPLAHQMLRGPRLRTKIEIADSTGS
jgi:hypothetical protein